MGPDDCYRLSFLLPRALALGVAPGRHQPCLHGCVLRIHQSGLVTLDGPSRERVFEQARRFLKIHTRGHGALSIAAVLVTPRRCADPAVTGFDSWRLGRGGRDGWTIIVGAAIAFSPTSIPPDLGEEQTAVAAQ